MHPKDLSIQDFNYHLPDDKIAKFPLPVRDESKLLVYKNDTIKTCVFNSIHQEIPSNSFVVFNNTKVVEARLLFTNSNGATIEIFCLEPSNSYNDITTAMLQKKQVQWKCLVGKAKKWKPNEILVGQVITPNGTTLTLQAVLVEKRNDYFLIQFDWNVFDLSFAEVLHIAGSIPLPPYLKREVEEQDKQTYQTTYAKHDGSVAAPTAGLHFTERVFNSFKAKHIQHQFVTLHVGAGTFKPVKASTMHEHDMHAEFIEVEVAFIETLINQHQNPVIVVGTTSLRTIESLYWLGIKIITNKISDNILELKQWDAYELNENINVSDALQALLDYATQNKLNKILAKTQIIIAPGYKLKIANAIITNFHQPCSTLILLIASIVGDDWRKIYDYALQNEFRFLSYGDSSLLWAKHI
jgi:S-adenosylmethionine:tRNA ribosyltransferase-isomerase